MSKGGVPTHTNKLDPLPLTVVVSFVVGDGLSVSRRQCTHRHRCGLMLEISLHGVEMMLAIGLDGELGYSVRCAFEAGDIAGDILVDHKANKQVTPALWQVSLPV